ncbi:MAG: hypothetical protein NTW87_09915 [Planctomycetota bacterium]|nr:hypothetical protein [Planctomycetota bacterium]
MPTIVEVRRSLAVFADVLSSLPAGERTKQTASGQYAEQFNKYLALARQVLPNVDAHLWPSDVIIRPMVRPGEKVTEAHYAEIETYARLALAQFPPEERELVFSASEQQP